jgi:predicted KAP-like P-loop ATPase
MSDQPSVGITPDVPIADFDQDRLGRTNFARALGRVFASYDRPDTLVIGLYGEWGLGKTSLLNLALKSVSEMEPRPIIVEFNPWYFADRDNLLRQFFEALSLAIAHKGNAERYRHISELLKLLSTSIDSLGALPGAATVTQPVSGFAKFFGKRAEEKATEADSLDAIKDDISKALVEGKRRVIVVMDDLDRLSAAEVRIVFQVVKALADFKYTTYILAFDDQAVAKALQDVQGIDGARYLEKIVNAPIRVPPISPSKMTQLVLDVVNDFAGQHKDYNWDDPDRAEPVISFLSTHCRTMRHLLRLANALYVDVQAIDGEVDGFDFVGITALRTFAPTVYEFVRDNRDLFIYTNRVLVDKERQDADARQALAQFYSDAKLREPAVELLRSLFPRLRKIQ